MRARETRERSNDIINNILKDTIDETTLYLPQIKSIKKNIRRTRDEVIKTSEFTLNDIPDHLRYDEDGNEFLRFDSGIHDKERILIFANEKKLKLLEHIEVCIIDGTFRSCPSGFYQVIVIHGLIFGSSYPIFYCVLNSKTQSIYERCFQFCLKINFFFPKYIILDFEKSLLNAAKNIFPYTTTKGCYFHFTQSLWRRVQTTHLIPFFKKKQIN